YRQFTQVGLEALGSDDPSLDAESILLLADLLERAETRGVRFRVSSPGTAETRRAYSDELRGHLRAREDQLSDDVRSRLDRNPLRAFDSDHAGTRAALDGAPQLLDRLAPEDAEHFDEVRRLLDDAGLEYEVDGTLVRGLDYYTRTVFEVESTELGAQSALGGGGRYDGLVELLGGPHVPAVGWAAGVERILLAAGGKAPAERPDVYIALADGAAAPAAFILAQDLRSRGVAADLEQAGRSLKGQLKHADRLGVARVVILGEAIEIKDMATGEQHAVATLEDALAERA